jgi:hypothetical protein
MLRAELLLVACPQVLLQVQRRVQRPRLLHPKSWVPCQQIHRPQLCLFQVRRV